MKQIYCIFILSFLGVTTLQSSFAASSASYGPSALEDEALAMFGVANACDEAGRMLDSFVATKQQYVAYLSSLTPDDSTVLAELGGFKEMISPFECTNFKEDLEKFKNLERKSLMDKEIVESCSAIRYFLIERDEYLQKVRRDYEKLFCTYPDALGVYEEEYTFTHGLVELFLGCLSEEYKEIYARLKVDRISARPAGDLLPGVHRSAERVEIVSTKGIWTCLPLDEFTKAPTIEFLNSTCVALNLDSGISVELSEGQEELRGLLASIESIGSTMEPAWVMGAIDLYNAGVAAEAAKIAESDAIIAKAHASIARSDAIIAEARAATAEIYAKMAADHALKMAEFDAMEARRAKEATEMEARKPLSQRERLRESLLKRRTTGSTPAAGDSATASSALTVPEPELSCVVSQSTGKGKGKKPSKKATSAPRAGTGGSGSSAASARISAEDAERARVESERVLAAAKAAEEKIQLRAITLRLFQQQRDHQAKMDRQYSQRAGLTKPQIETLGVVLGLKMNGIIRDIHEIKQPSLDALLGALNADVSLHRFHAGGGQENPGMGWNDLAILKTKLARIGFTEEKLTGIYHSSCAQRSLSY